MYLVVRFKCFRRCIASFISIQFEHWGFITLANIW